MECDVSCGLVTYGLYYIETTEVRGDLSHCLDSIRPQNLFLSFAEVSVQFSSVAQSCPTLCDPTNRSMPGLRVHHQLPEPTQTPYPCIKNHFFFLFVKNIKMKSIFFKFYSPVCSVVWLFATPWTVAHQATLSMGFPRQEYWSGLPFPSPGDLPHPGIKPASLRSLPLPVGLLTTNATWEDQFSI